MKCIRTIEEIRVCLKEQRKDGKTIGFVPTMGYFHEGHLSLMREAKSRCQIVVVSIFVNPTQFGPNEDFAAYPRDEERDLSLCEKEGVDFVFAPSVKEMYPEEYSTYVECEGEITKVLCGKSRPGHFKGVTSVVAKLFHIVNPDCAFFGQKDAQQVAVIEKMVRELNMDLQIIPCPIKREKDGLAMSSRNVYLSERGRKEALCLKQSLDLAQREIESGMRDSIKIKEKMQQFITGFSLSQVDYIEIVSAKTLKKLEEVKGEILIAVAVRVEKTRLIDNMRLSV